jgi:hypothetical protein
MAMTSDLIAVRRSYTNWPVLVIIAHLILIDLKVEEMKADDMLEARQLMDEKLPQWR